MSINKVVIVGSMLVAAGAIAYAIYNYVKREMQLAMSFCYKFSGVQIIKASNDQFIMNITIRIRNQSDLRVMLDSYMLEVFIQNKFITTIASITKVDLLANAVSEIPMKIEFNPQKLFNLADIITLTAAALTDQEKFIIRLKGSISASVNFIKVKDVPIDMSMSLAEIMKPSDINNKIDCKIV